MERKRRNRNRLRQILGIVLCFMLLLGMIPATAVTARADTAVTLTQSNINDNLTLKDGYTYTLAEDVTINSSITFTGGSATLKLGNHTITQVHSGAAILVEGASARLYVSEGTITNGETVTGGAGGIRVVGSQVYLSNVAIKNCKGTTGGGICILADGIVRYYSGCTMSGNQAVMGENLYIYNGKFYMVGGSIDAGTQSQYSDIYNNDTLYALGGEIKCDVTNTDKGKISGNGKTSFYGAVSGGTIDESACPYTVTFDAAGGSPTPDVQHILAGSQKAAEPATAPTRDGYQFAGWYKDGSKYNFNTVVGGSFTLTAGWTKDISNLDVSVNGPFTYDGGTKTPTITVKDGTTTLKAGTDYSLSGDTSGKDAKVYTVTITGTGNYTGTKTVTWRIRAAQSIAADDITTVYGASGVKIGATGVGVLAYAVTSGSDVISVDATSGAITIKKAGTAKVKVTASGDDTHLAAEKEITVTVNKADSTLHSYPLNPVYNGTAQALVQVSADRTSGGTVKFSLDNGKTWSETVPTATDAGNYPIKCKVFGDANHNDSSIAGYTAKITRRDIADAVIAMRADHLVWTGEEQSAPIASIEIEGVTGDVTYTITSGGTGTDAGAYTLVIEGTGNFTGTTSIEWEIFKRGHIKYTWTGADDLVDVTLPEDPYVYVDLDAAVAAEKDTTFAAGTTAKDADGYVYSFSGWDAGTADGENGILTYSGSWSISEPTWNADWLSEEDAHFSFQCETNSEHTTQIYPKNLSDSEYTVTGPVRAKSHDKHIWRFRITLNDPENYYPGDHTEGSGSAGPIQIDIDPATGEPASAEYGTYHMEDPEYTVIYTDGTGKEAVFADQKANVISGSATPAFDNGDGSTTPSRDGYVFGGWDPAQAETVTGDVTYTAIWKADRNGNGIADETETEHSVTVSVNDETRGTASASPADGLLIGETVTLTAEPAEGYVLTGWEFASGSRTIENNTFSMPDWDVEITAIFKPSTYTVSYKASEDAETAARAVTSPWDKKVTLEEDIFTEAGVQTQWLWYSVGEDGTLSYYGLGEEYTKGESVTLYPLVEKVETYTVPYAMEVKQGGEAEPEDADFALELITWKLEESAETMNIVTVSGTEIHTTGAGTYDGMLNITGTAPDINSLYSTFFVRQKTGDAEGWTYADEVWAVLSTFNDDGQFAGWEIYPAKANPEEQGEDDPYWMPYIADMGDDPEQPSAPVEKMTFTNTYTASKSVSAEKKFIDVAGNMYYADSVYWASKGNITTGYDNGDDTWSFHPDDPCTRAQFSTFLWRACGTPETTFSDNPFSDVPDLNNQYYANAVLWAYEKRILTGYIDGNKAILAPDTPVTRGQVVTFLWRAAGSPKAKSDEIRFKDVTSDQYYSEAVRWASEKNITAGYNNGDGTYSFSPNERCTRGQAMTFLYRYSQTTEE